MKKKLNKTHRGFILAEGEVTGHAHCIEDDIELYEMENGKKLIESNSTFTITHEEHKPITVEEPGSYEVGIVREYDPFLEEAREVLD